MEFLLDQLLFISLWVSFAMMLIAFGLLLFDAIAKVYVAIKKLF